MSSLDIRQAVAFLPLDVFGKDCSVISEIGYTGSFPNKEKIQEQIVLLKNGFSKKGIGKSDFIMLAVILAASSTALFLVFA